MKKNKGFVLLFTLAILLLFILIATTFFVVTSNELSMAHSVSNSLRAYYIAEAGLARKFMDLRSGSVSSVFEIFTLAPGDSGSYSAAVTPVDLGRFSTYRIDSTCTYRGMNKRLSLTVRQVSFARYGYLSNNENGLFWGVLEPIWFVTRDTLRGPLHTNDRLNISGNPIFEGAVSSVSPTINYYHGGPPNDNPDFRESLTLGAPRIQLPSSAELIGAIMTAAQEHGGLFLTGNTAITLLPGRTMNITNEAMAWDNQNVPAPSNGVLFVSGGYVEIAGIVDGQLTVGTNGNIYITGNLLYNTSPLVNPSSTDMLGLVSQNNIYVDADAPYNLEIDAYIVALNTSFAVENYNVGLKGILTICGGITQESRGPVGTFNSRTNSKVSGYTKNYYYDERLVNAAPPYFPPARDENGRIVYLKVLWEEY